MRSIHPDTIAQIADSTRRFTALFAPIRELIDRLTAPIRELNRHFDFFGELHRPLTEPARRLNDAIAATYSLNDRRTPAHHRPIELDPPPAPLSLQGKYNKWVKGRVQAPTRGEDRVWAAARSISVRRVAQLRAHNPDPRLRRRGPRPK